MFSLQASVNQIKAAINELETAGEEQVNDIRSLVIFIFISLALF